MIVLLCVGCALGGFLIGLSLAARIAEHKLEVMRLEAGLSMDPSDAEAIDKRAREWELLFKDNEE